MRDKVVEKDQDASQYRRGSDNVSISLAPILGAEADHLFVLSDQCMASLYPAESNHLVSRESLQTSNAVFLGAFVSSTMSSSLKTAYQPAKTDELRSVTDAGECIACAAARLYREAGYAEIKRLFVHKTYRGRGLSRTLMSAIEAEILAQVSTAFVWRWVFISLRPMPYTDRSVIATFSPSAIT